MSGTQHPPPEGNERRLAAIVFTDVAGYSARMQRDETGTLTLVRADFERMRTLCAQHGGEVLKSTGDGLLLCFGSVVQAVACALQIQKEFSARPPDALQHRIGIHLGDVFREGGDVTGDGVNIAARLQTKARPGTTCLSQSVYDAVLGKVPMQVEPLGPQQFKNIGQPINVYLVVAAGAALPVAVRKKSRPGWWVAAALAIAALLAVLFWTKPAPSVDAPRPATPAPLAPVSDKSIAVLPFTNMSDDKDSGYFADGVHEDVLTNLANMGDLRVVSRTSVMQYRGTTKTMRQIASELGVAYILESSVRRAGNTVRVTGQLINARTDEHVWAKSYDRELKDVFAIQSALAIEIADTLKVVLSPLDKARLQRAPTSSAAAYDLYLRAMEIRNQDPLSLEGSNRAAPLLQSAVELDPGFASAWGELAATHLAISNRSYDPTGSHLEQARLASETMERLAPDEPDTWLQLANYHASLTDFLRSEEYIRRAAAALPNNSRVVMQLGHVAKRNGRLADALRHYRKAHELDRQNPEARGALESWLLNTRLYDEAMALEQKDSRDDGYTLALLAFYARGSTKEMEAWIAVHPAFTIEGLMSWKFRTGDVAAFIRLADQARRSQPAGYMHSYAESQYAVCLMAMGRVDQAKEAWVKNLARIRASSQPVNAGVAVTLAYLGEKEAAFAALDELQAQRKKQGVNPDFISDSQAKLSMLVWTGERDQALAEVARLLGVPSGLNVHELRRSPFWKPLQDDPRFEAILNDPKNNAPLL